MFKKNYDHLPKEVYFGNYKDATRGNPNYFLTYGNGKSAARIQDHLRPNGAHRWHNYMKSPKHVNFVLFKKKIFLVALLGRGEGRWVKPVTWGLGMGGRCQLSYKPIGIDSVTFQKFNVHVFHHQCFKGLCMCALRLTIDMLVLVKVQYNMLYIIIHELLGILEISTYVILVFFLPSNPFFLSIGIPACNK